MGVHGNAEKIVREFGFSPTQSHATTKPHLTASSRHREAEHVVEALDELMSKEGLVRVYALLKSALSTSTPRFDIGTGGKVLVSAIEKKLEPAMQDKETLTKIKEMKGQLDSLEKEVRERNR